MKIVYVIIHNGICIDIQYIYDLSIQGRALSEIGFSIFNIILSPHEETK